MPLADTFQEILDSLPSDWTDLELDLRVEEDRYVDAASLVVTCNAQPYSRNDWHWRLIVAHHFGTPPRRRPSGHPQLLDDAGSPARAPCARSARAAPRCIPDLGLRWKSYRQEFRRLRSVAAPGHGFLTGPTWSKSNVRRRSTPFFAAHRRSTGSRSCLARGRPP